MDLFLIFFQTINVENIINVSLSTHLLLLSDVIITVIKVYLYKAPESKKSLGAECKVSTLDLL